MRRTGIDGQGDDDRFGSEPLFDLVQRSVKVGTFAVHFVDKGDTRNVVFVRLSPNGFALGFNAFTGTENDDSAVECGSSNSYTPNSFFPASM